MKIKIVLLLITIGLSSCFLPESKLPENFDYGHVEDNVYKNEYFQMEIPFNPDWMLQSQEQMNDMMASAEDLVVGDNQNLKSAIKASQVNTANLFSIFKFEVGTPVSYNPSCMLVAENTKNFPGIKAGKDYLYHTKKVLQQTQLDYSFTKDNYKKKVGGKTFDAMEAQLNYLGQIITQEYFAIVSKGFSLTFIISYTTDDEKEELYSLLEGIRI